MSRGLMDIFIVIGAQHLWQSAVLLLLAWSAFKLRPLSADARAWLWLCFFICAAISPIAVFLPGENSVVTIPMAAVQGAVDVSPSGIADTGRSTAADSSMADGVSSVLKPVALLVWMFGSAWSLQRLCAGWCVSRRLRDTARISPHLQRLLAHELPGNTMVKVSDRVASPMTVSLLNPCILVPQRLVAELEESVLQNVLYHEIAHIRRRDLWILLAQGTLTAFYWWNPLFRLLGARLDLAREMACDERAAVQSGGGRAYARSLLTSADKLLSFNHPHQLLAVGIFGTRKSLAQRIEGLLSMDAGMITRGYKPAALLCTAVLLASATLTLAATPRLGVPQSAKARQQVEAGWIRQLVDAAGTGQLDEVGRLVRRGVDIDAPSVGDGTALIAATKVGDQQMITALIRMGADVNQPASGDGNPLIMAAMTGQQDVVAQLVAYGANVNAVVRGDETPLINAAREGHLSIVEYLVEHGADVNLGVRADFGRWRSPLNQAQDSDVRNYLIGMGAVSGT